MKSEPKNTKNLPHHLAIRVAARSEADPRTVQRVWRGESVRAGVAERIGRALEAEGLLAAEPVANRAPPRELDQPKIR